MAGIQLGSLLAAYEFVIHIIIYLSIIILLIKVKGAKSKLHLLVVVAGFFFIIGVLDFYRAQFFILAWLVLNKIPLMIDRLTAIILIVVLAFFMIALPQIYFVVSFAIYVLIIFGLIRDAFAVNKE